MHIMEACDLHSCHIVTYARGRHAASEDKKQVHEMLGQSFSLAACSKDAQHMRDGANADAT